MGIKSIFDAGLNEGQERASSTTVLLLVFCGFLTGTGGAGGASGSLNTVAKSFPEHIVSTGIYPVTFAAMPTTRLLHTENQFHSVRIIWFWTVSLLVLDNCACGLPWKHL